MKEAQPTIFLGVPRVWEKIYEKMVEVGRQNKGLKQQIGESYFYLLTLFGKIIFERLRELTQVVRGRREVAFKIPLNSMSICTSQYRTPQKGLLYVV